MNINKAESLNNKASQIEKDRNTALRVLRKSDKVSNTIHNLIFDNVSLYPNVAKSVVKVLHELKPFPSEEVKQRVLNSLMNTPVYYNTFGQALK